MRKPTCLESGFKNISGERHRREFILYITYDSKNKYIPLIVGEVAVPCDSQPALARMNSFSAV